MTRTKKPIKLAVYGIQQRHGHNDWAPRVDRDATTESRFLNAPEPSGRMAEPMQTNGKSVARSQTQFVVANSQAPTLQTSDVPTAAATAQAMAQEGGELNFDAAPGIEARSAEQIGANVELLHAATGAGMSVALALAAALLSVGVGRFLSAHTPADVKRGTGQSAHISRSWHVVSFLVASFLGLNVFFGGMTAFLLNETPEDARAYFTEMSALKLARLSHEHFFGYGLLFGTIVALALFFVSPNRKRVLVPAMAVFVFSALDAFSWWLSRFVSTGFHTLSYITGAVFALGFLALYLQIISVNLKAVFRKFPKETTLD